jgi:hypothetical protein
MQSFLRDRDAAPNGSHFVAAVLAWIAGWFVLAWPWLSGRVTIPWDAKAQFQPQIQFMADSLARGESPFWNPYVFSGHPQIADPQSMLFSPPFMLLALVDKAPSLWAVDTTVFVSILIGGLALVVWFMDRGWHWAGGVIAALAFGFGAAMAWRIQHTGQVLSLALLPIVVLLLDRALMDRQGAPTFGDEPRSQAVRVMYGLGAGIVAAMLVLGRDQVALLSVYVLIAFVAWRLFGFARDGDAPLGHAAAPLIAATLVGLAIVALPVMMTAAMTDQSNRPEIDFIGAGRGSWHPALGFTFFMPDLFGSSGRSWDYWGPPSFAWPGTDLFLAQNMGQLYLGAIPALMILVGLGSGASWRREIRFFTVALGVVTLYALGWFTPFFKVVHTVLPGVDLYRRPADAVFLMGYLGAVLAGYSTHVLLNDDHFVMSRAVRRGILLAAVVTLAAFALGLGLAIRMDHIGMATRPLVVSSVLFAMAAAVILDALWLLPVRPVMASAVLIAFTVGDLAISNGPGSATALPPSTYEALEPGTPNETVAILKRKTAEGRSDTRRDRVELAGLGFHWPNAGMTHRLENTLGYNPVRLGLYSRATGAGDTVGLPEDRKFSTLFPSYKSQLADLLGLRYIATGVPLQQIDPAAQESDFPLVAKTRDGFIYENPRALPRAVFATSAAPADFDLIMTTGKWPDEDLTATVLLSPEDEKASGLIATRGKGAVRIKSYTNTDVVIEVDSTRGGYVVLFDLWHPWWVATLDNSATPLLRGDVLFRAVRVPSGRHTIGFAFRPIRGALADTVVKN